MAKLTEQFACVEATKRANYERLRRFKILTQDNFDEASSFYKKRFRYWKNNLENAEALPHNKNAVYGDVA